MARIATAGEVVGLLVGVECARIVRGVEGGVEAVVVVRLQPQSAAGAEVRAAVPRSVRGMVGVGLLTPEQLVEIHEVGAQMERLKPDLVQAGSIADAAVQQDAEERKQLKERKKAEAAERKRKHAEDVARRKLTDIFFLGRGVSGGLSDRRANVEKLQKLQLPVLAGDIREQRMGGSGWTYILWGKQR